MPDLNLGLLTATKTEASAATCTATIAAIPGKQIFVTGFDGSSSDQPFTVTLNAGATQLLAMQGSADTTIGRDFGPNNGIACGDNTAVTVVVTPSAVGQGNANIVYKIIF